MKRHHFCQIEIRVDDVRRAADFYGAVFDWTVRATDASYAICDAGGDPLGALMARPQPHVPLGVSPYVLVDDAKASRDAAVELGARVFVEPNLIQGSGAWATIIDPWGNEIAFWQPLNGWRIGYQGSGANRFTWIEIPVGDLEAGVRFYSRLFGWSFQVQPGVDHFAFVTEPDRAMGVGLISAGGGQPMKGTTPYVSVADVHATVERIGEVGGRVIVQPEASPDGHKFAVFLDPDHNRLGLSQGRG